MPLIQGPGEFSWKSAMYSSKLEFIRKLTYALISRAVAGSHHKLSGFTQVKFIILQFWSLQVQDGFHSGQHEGVCKNPVPSGSSGKNPRGAHSPWLPAPSATFKARQGWSNASLTTSLPASSTCQDPWDDTGSVWIIYFVSVDGEP